MKKMLFQALLFVGMIFLRLEGAVYQESDLFEFYENEVFVPSSLGDLKLYKDNEGFHILKDGKVYDIQNCWCKKLNGWNLNELSNEQLAGFLGRNKPKFIMMTPEEFNELDCTVIREITGEEKNELLSKLFGGGYISVHQMSDGEYALEAKIRLLGGMSWWGLVCIGVGVGAVLGLGVAGIIILVKAAALTATAASAAGATATAVATASGAGTTAASTIGVAAASAVTAATTTCATAAGVAAFKAATVVGIEVAAAEVIGTAAAAAVTGVATTAATATGTIFTVGGVVGAAVGGGGVMGILKAEETIEKNDEENPCMDNQFVLPEIDKGGPGSIYKPADKPISKKICPSIF